MASNTLVQAYLKELKAESAATRKCLERIPENVYEFKPHEKSMAMGYLTLLVAEIPKWITSMIEQSEIDFATFQHFKLSTASALLAHYEENLQGASNALEKADDEDLAESLFYLKANGQVLFSSPKTGKYRQHAQPLGASPGTAHGLYAPQQYCRPIYIWSFGG